MLNKSLLTLSIDRECILQKKTPSVTVEDAIGAQEIAKKMVKSAEA